LASNILEQDSSSQNDRWAKRLGNQQTLARGSYFPPQGFAQVPATEVDELPPSADSTPLDWLFRIRKAICSTKGEVTNRQRAV
jgi:hypothetical protein